jgi:protein SCO1/2
MTSRVEILLRCLVALAALATASPTLARAEQQVPPELRGIEIEERLGANLPLSTELVDHTGKKVRLGDSFTSKRPVILVLNYYGCPTLCSLVLNALVEGLRGLEYTVGKDFEVLSVSIDPREGPELARSKREAYLLSYGRKVEPSAWPFFTATEEASTAIAKAVGFHYRYDAATKQYAHAAGIFVLTPEGRLSQTLYGVIFAPRDLRLALVEAGKGSIGSPLDRFLLFCYHYDPQTRRYGLTPMGVMRIGGVITIVFLGLFLLSARRRERRASVSG